MSKKLYEEGNIQNIASAIRNKLGVSDTYLTSEMADAILSITTEPTLESITISSNGSYSPGVGVDGFSNVVVSVPASGGILISKSISQNGTYIALDDSADGYSEVVVSVQGGGSDETIKVLAGVQSGSINTDVSSIRAYFAYQNTYITGLYAPNVKTIGDSAFHTCSKMLAISLPSVEVVGSYAFKDCYRLRTIELPNCNTIKNAAFDHCMSVSQFSFPNCTSIGYGALSGCTEMTDIYAPNCTYISNCAFYGCSRLTSVYFPNVAVSSGVTDGMRSVFMQCQNLKTVNLENVKIIGQYCFNDCPNLENVILTNCIFISGWENASPFAGCGKLSYINLPACTSLGNNVFDGRTALEIVSAPFLSRIGSWTFRKAGITSAIYPELSTMGSRAFGSCFYLAEVCMPKLTVLAVNAFDYCSSLTSVEFPSVSRAISGSDNGNGQFGYCINLKTASFPILSGVANSMFKFCSSLESLYLLSTSVAVLSHSNAFASTPIVDSSYLGYFGSIFVPESLVDAYKSATNWSFYSDRITAYIEQ